MTVTGKVVGQHRYIHTQLLSHLSNDDRDRVESAIHIAQVSPSKQFNVVKLAANTAQVTLLDYPDFFEEAFPVLRRFWTVDLEQGTCRHRTYEDSTNPPILHRKELLLPSNHPSQRDYTELTLAAEQIGLFDDTARIGFQRPWVALLTQKGYRVADHQLVPIGNNEASEEVPGQEVFTNRLIEELPNQIYTAPVLEGNLGAFSANCILPELADYPGKLNGLVSAPDVWVHMAAPGWINPGRVTPYVDSTGASSILDCEQAMSALAVDTLAAADRQLKYLSDRLHPGGGVLQTTIAGQLSDFETAMLGINRTADQTIRHYAMINIVKHSAENAAGIAAATFTAKQLDTSYFTMKTVAEGALPKLRNLIEALIYAVFPIVFLLVIAAGAMGGKVLSMYAMAAVWIHLWAPLYAVIHSFMHRSSKDGMLQITEAAGGTIENLPHLLQMTVSDQGMAGLMVISVPAIALAIVKGGAVAMSGVVNSLMSPAQSAAARMGSEMGMGNISGAKVNWGGANFDSSISRKGSSMTETMGGFSAHYDQGGKLMSVSGGAATMDSNYQTARSRVESSGREVTSASQQVGEKVNAAVSAIENSSQYKATREMANVLTNMGGTNKTADNVTSSGNASIAGSSDTSRGGVAAHQDLSDAWKLEGGLGTQGNAQQVSHGGGGKPGGGGAAGNAGRLLGLAAMLKGGLTGSKIETDSFRTNLENLSSLDNQKRQDAQKGIQEASGYFSRLAGETKDMNSKQALESLAASLKDSVTASEKLSQSLTDAEKAGFTISDTTQRSNGATARSETAAVMAATGGDQSFAAIVQAMTGAQFDPSGEVQHLTRSVPSSSQGGFDIVAPTPGSPDALKQSGQAAASNFAAQAFGDVKADHDKNEAAVTGEMLAQAGFTPQEIVNAQGRIDQANSGYKALSGDMNAATEQTHAIIGARNAAMAISQREMESYEQDFTREQLQSRIAENGAKILVASESNPELRSALVDNGARPAGAPGGYSPQELSSIQESSNVRPRPRDEGKNLGQTGDGMFN